MSACSASGSDSFSVGVVCPCTCPISVSVLCPRLAFVYLQCNYMYWYVLRMSPHSPFCATTWSWPIGRTIWNRKNTRSRSVCYCTADTECNCHVITCIDLYWSYTTLRCIASSESWLRSEMSRWRVRNDQYSCFSDD